MVIISFIKVMTLLGSNALVVLNVGVLTIISFVHPVELVKDILLVVVNDHGRDGRSPLCRLLLQLLLLRRIRNHVNLP